MKRFAFSIAASLLVLAGQPAAAGGDALRNGAVAASNRIVGTWDNVAQVGPCGGPVGANQYQTVVFQAGGTFLDSPRYPPQGIANMMGIPGIHQRGVGVGDWSYSPITRQYTLDQRFDWFVDNVYNGYQVVHRTMMLSNDGKTATGPVQTVRYATDGSIIAELCGTGTSTRP